MKRFLGIIISNYHHDQYLPQCLASIEAQTDPDYRVYLVHDAGPLNECLAGVTVHRVDRNGRDVITHYNKKRRGQAANFNRCKDVIDCEYISFLSADDWLETDRIAVLKKYVPFDVAWTNSQYHHKMEWFRFSPGQWDKQGFIGGNYIPSGSCVFKWDFVKDVYFPLITRGEDYIFMAKCMAAGAQWKYIPDLTFNYRMNSGTAYNFWTKTRVMRYLYRHFLSLWVRKILWEK